MNTDVRIETDKSQKYVLAHGEDRVFLWGDPTAVWHKDIVEEIPVKMLSVKGGGKIKVATEHKQIYLWDTSSRYGKPPLEEVGRILEEFFIGYKIIQGEPFDLL